MTLLYLGGISNAGKIILIVIIILIDAALVALPSNAHIEIHFV